jgi:hypothetical protein
MITIKILRNHHLRQLFAYHVQDTNDQLFLFHVDTWLLVCHALTLWHHVQCVDQISSNIENFWMIIRYMIFQIIFMNNKKNSPLLTIKTSNDYIKFLSSMFLRTIIDIVFFLSRQWQAQLTCTYLSFFFISIVLVTNSTITINGSSSLLCHRYSWSCRKGLVFFSLLYFNVCHLFENVDVIIRRRQNVCTDVWGGVSACIWCRRRWVASSLRPFFSRSLSLSLFHTKDHLFDIIFYWTRNISTLTHTNWWSVSQ